MNRGPVAVAVSGGTDSLMSLVALVEAGETVSALHAFFLPPDQARRTVALALETICRSLGVAFHVEDLSREFEANVVAPFAAAYAAGLTPNPCVHCNRRMKFGLLFEAARRHGAERLATGHYAGLRPQPDGGAALYRGEDDTRDQSYFLSLIPAEVLRTVVFPLAERRKTAVRGDLAGRGLAPPLPSESQDICFVVGNDYTVFLRERGLILSGEGPILLEDGREVGRHRGLWRHTVGQRRGLGVAYREPLYVLDKDLARNALVVGPRRSLGASGCRVDAPNVLVDPGRWPEDVFVRTCSRMRPRPARAVWRGGGLDIAFVEPLTRPAPGQVAVLYDADGRVLTGGVIVSSRFTDR